VNPLTGHDVRQQTIEAMMIKNIFRWGLIVLLVLISPLIFIEVLSYLTVNIEFYVIKAFQAKSTMSLATIMITINLISAIITAFITAFPSGYIAKKQARVIAIIFVISIEYFPIYTFFQTPEYKALITSVLSGQFFAVVLSVVFFAEIGSRLEKK